MGTYVVSDQSLPRSLDVQISLSRPQAEKRTNLTVLCCVAENLGLLPDARRVRFYSDLTAVGIDFASNSEAYLMAETFMSQEPRPPQMAIGQVWLTPLYAQLVGMPLSAADIAATKLITDGSMDLTYNNNIMGSGSATLVSLTGMNFSTITNISDINTIIAAHLPGGLHSKVQTLPGGDQVIVIYTTATGNNVVISFPTAHSTGTYVGTLLNFSAVSGGTCLNGYTPTDIAGELDNLKSAANANGEFFYGWAFAASMRDVAIQTIAAQWALAQVYALMGLTTNDITAYSPSYSTDIGKVVLNTGNKRVFTNYHNNVQRYPEISIMAYMLSVNYQLEFSVVTAKFKQLPGIETVPLTETQWATLKTKGYNCYTATGNSAKVYREGETDNIGWFLDTVINLDNFVEDLSTNVFNVFLRNKVVPYTRRGIAMLLDACNETGRQYIYNGTFADRDVADTTRKSGYRTIPGVTFTPTPLQNQSDADRASRIGPPIGGVVYEAGAIHSIAINVESLS